MELALHLTFFWIGIMAAIAIGLLSHDPKKEWTRLQDVIGFVIYAIVCMVFLEIMLWGIILIQYLFT
jgi:hypothetical protein